MAPTSASPVDEGLSVFMPLFRVHHDATSTKGTQVVRMIKAMGNDIAELVNASVLHTQIQGLAGVLNEQGTLGDRLSCDLAKRCRKTKEMRHRSEERRVGKECR